MNNEVNITCPLCKSPSCVAITGPKGSGLKFYQCPDCGYMSYNTYSIGSTFLINFENQLPAIVRALRRVDEKRNIVWYPRMITMPYGIITPEGNDAEDWKWSVFIFKTPIDVVLLNSLPPEDFMKILSESEKTQYEQNFREAFTYFLSHGNAKNEKNVQTKD